MIPFKDKQFLLFTDKFFEELLCVSITDHFVLVGSQKEYAFLLTVGVYLFDDIQLTQAHSGFFMDIFVHRPVDTGKKAMKAAQATAGNLLLRNLLAKHL